MNLKIALGSAQFGLKYGITGGAEQTSFEDAEKIIRYAESVGINTIDTAPAYGNSEEVIGDILQKNHQFNITTKIPPINHQEISLRDVKSVELIVQNSLRKLNCEKIEGVLFHQAADVLKRNGEMLYEKLVELKSLGWINKIGFSIYESSQIDQLCQTFSFDLIQLPINVFDQRLLQSGHLKKLKKAGIEVYARSIFLQGLLLSDQNAIPSKLDGIANQLVAYQQFLQRNGMLRIDGALDFMKQIKEIDYLVVGVNDVKQLIEIKQSFDKPSQAAHDYTHFAIDDIDLIDPRRW